MNHYQKLAVLWVRGVAMMMAALGLLGAVYGLVLLRSGAEFNADQTERFNASFWYIVVGPIVFFMARPVGRLLGYGLQVEPAPSEPRVGE